MLRQSSITITSRAVAFGFQTCQSLWLIVCTEVPSGRHGRECMLAATFRLIREDRPCGRMRTEKDTNDAI